MSEEDVARLQQDVLTLLRVANSVEGELRSALADRDHGDQVVTLGVRAVRAMIRDLEAAVAQANAK